MGDTKIEWADSVWNPVTGCTPISEGCANCYAKRMAQRLKGRFGYPADDPFRVTIHRDKLDESKKWGKTPKRIFVCSMGDLFHPEVPLEFILTVFDIMSRHPEHIFLVLSKRPERMLEFCVHWGLMPYPDLGITPSGQIWPVNVFPGVTAENQSRADERIPILLQIPAAKRFVSIEPILESIDLTFMDMSFRHPEWCRVNTLNGRQTDMGRPMPYVPHLDWVIAGGETGPGARPAKAEWFNNIIQQCRDAGVPVFVKKAPAGVEIIREFPKYRNLSTIVP